MSLYLRSLVGGMFVAVLSSSAEASLDSLGPNGINSLVTDLSGDGVHIGQVEPSHPGKPMPVGFDDAAHSGTTVFPDTVAIQDAEVTMGTANAFVSDHPQQVAGVMIAAHDTVTGVAPLALLHSSAFALGPPSEDVTALTMQYVAKQAGDSVRAINLSFGHPVLGDDTLDGNALFTQFLDWSANEHDCCTS
jgi:hypothetical protein